RGLRWTVAFCAVSGSLALAGAVEAAPPSDFGPKVDPSLAMVAQQAQANGGPQALVHVIAYGNDPSGAMARLGATNVQQLSLIGAYGATIRVANLSALAHSPTVDRITVDSPVETTGTTTLSTASIVTLYPKVDNVQAAWNLGLTGAGSSLAVLDSGVAPVADLGTRVTPVPGSSAIPNAN